MKKGNGRRQNNAVLAAAFVLGLAGATLTARPVDAADYQGCHSDTEGHAARGYCYPSVKTKDLRLWVRCEGDTFPNSARFDRQTYMSVPGRRGPMPMKAAVYDCKERKVVWHEVNKYNSWT
jgi:hypothetical protein